MPSTKRPRSLGAHHPQADHFERVPAARLAVEHSVPHEVISQVIRPDVAAFMADDRVVVRTHHDELCCVDTACFMSGGPPFDKDAVEYLEQFPHLVRLILEETAVVAPGLACVARLTQLQHLELTNCRGVDAAGLASVSNLSHLQRLHLSYCDGVDAAGLAEVAHLSELRHLELSSCNGVDDKGLVEVGKLQRLQHLDLTWCSNVGAEGLTVMLDKFPEVLY